MSDEIDLGKIGGVAVQASGSKIKRIAGLLWGGAGGGKTTLACTAPGRKLLISFDPDGHASVSDFGDVHVVDLSSTSHNVVEHFKSSNDPLGIGKLIENYDTIIIDSLTNVAYKALQYGIPKSNGATVERPSQQAYQIRNNLVLQLVKNVLALTGKYGKHVFFIAHEDAPVTDKEGVVLYISLSLGGKLPEQAALDFSEVWYVQDLGIGKARRITVRPARSRKPMKTRMFSTGNEAEFNWEYDPDTQEGMTIADWFDTWQEAGTKIPLPKPKKKVK